MVTLFLTLAIVLVAAAALAWWAWFRGLHLVFPQTLYDTNEERRKFEAWLLEWIAVPSEADCDDFALIGRLWDGRYYVQVIGTITPGKSAITRPLNWASALLAWK